MLQSIGSQRLRHDLVTEQQQKYFFCTPFFFLLELQCLDYVSHIYPLLCTELYSPIIHVELPSPNLTTFEYKAFLRLIEVNEVIRVGILI